MNATKMTGWDRFKDFIGCHWDAVYEAGLGDPTEAESTSIMDLGYWGQEITHQTVEGIKAGKKFSDIEKRKFVFTIYAPDGRHVHRHRSKKALVADVKRYGPPVYRKSNFCWSDDDGYTYEIEGDVTLHEIFPPAPVPPPPAAPQGDPDGLPSTLDEEKAWENHLDSKAAKDEDPRERGWL